MDTERLQSLLKKYTSQTATPEEIKIVEDWYDRVNAEVPEMDTEELDGAKEDIFARIDAGIAEPDQAEEEQRRTLFPYGFLMKAAVLTAVLLSLGYLFMLKPKRGVQSLATAKNVIEPGGNQAVLQLADGTRVVLNKASDGQISDQGGIKVTKTKNGELVYSMPEQQGTDLVRMNTVTTPRGGQYHLVLGDKTEVWLNSGSSISFPAAFTGAERKVAMTGEAYFEVAKNKAKPFIVSTGKSEIRVLGTHFNINSYNDEQKESTTLLEGSVRVSHSGRQLLLKPGQQASIASNSSSIELADIEDATSVIAWKNGYFQFENADLKAVMRQISRWYDTEVSYNGPVPVKQYTGKIPRNVSAKELVEMLAYSGIHCKIENGRIVVNPR